MIIILWSKQVYILEHFRPRQTPQKAVPQKKRDGTWFNPWTSAVQCHSWSQWSLPMLRFQSPSKQGGEASPLTQSRKLLVPYIMVMAPTLTCSLSSLKVLVVSGLWYSGTQAPWCSCCCEWSQRWPGAVVTELWGLTEWGVGRAVHWALMCYQPAGIVESKIHITKDL